MEQNIILAFIVFYPFLGAIISHVIGTKSEKIRNLFAEFVVVTEFIAMAYLMFVNYDKVGMTAVLDLHIPEICGFGMNFSLDGFRLIYGLIAALMWMMTTLLSSEYFAHHQNRNRFYTFLLLTLGATMGVFLSADLYTTFIFFEIMSLTSYVWVAQEENEESLRAAGTYLAVAVVGGLVMLMGIFMLYHELGTLSMSELMTAAKGYDNPTILYAIGICLFIGFGAKAGAFPLHIWLPKAHPVAPAPASALLSGILTKTGIFGILVVSSNLFFQDALWGKIVLVIGVITMFGGALLAVFSVDLKRTLACSSMSQIGFIMVGIGMMGLLAEENVLAVQGTFVHMINHSLIKLVLFMAAGVVYMNAHALNLNEIRGFGRKKNLLKAIFASGALSIAGIPLFSGYISKTLLHESIVEFHGGILMDVVEYVFLFSGGLTLAYMTKLFVAVFVEKNEDEQKQKQYDTQKKYMNGKSGVALVVSALILFVWGLFPHSVIDKIAAMGYRFLNFFGHAHAVEYFNLTNLSGALITLAVGAVVYFGFVRTVLIRNGKYVDCWPKWLDMENLIYRPILLHFLPWLFGILCRICDSFVDLFVVLLRKTTYKDSPLPYERPEGNVITELIGKIMNRIRYVKRRIRRQEITDGKDYTHIVAGKAEELLEDAHIIQRSLSFGLLMFGVGLALTLIYLMWF